jgi:hypothetical protein
MFGLSCAVLVIVLPNPNVELWCLPMANVRSSCRTPVQRFKDYKIGWLRPRTTSRSRLLFFRVSWFGAAPGPTGSSEPLELPSTTFERCDVTFGGLTETSTAGLIRIIEFSVFISSKASAVRISI